MIVMIIIVVMVVMVTKVIRDKMVIMVALLSVTCGEELKVCQQNQHYLLQVTMRIQLHLSHEKQKRRKTF